MDDDMLWECHGCGKIMVAEEMDGDPDDDDDAPACPECGANSLSLVSGD